MDNKRKLIFISSTVLIFIIGLSLGYLLGNKNLSFFQSRPAPIKTANWETYVDPDYNFTFMYPPNWYLFPEKYDNDTAKMIFLDKKEIVLSATNEHKRLGLINVQIQPVSNVQLESNSRTQDPIEAMGFNKYPVAKIGSEPQIIARKVEEITPNNLVRQEDRNKKYIAYIFARGKKSLFTISIQTDVSDKQNISIFNQILSTFRFD